MRIGSPAARRSRPSLSVLFAGLVVVGLTSVVEAGTREDIQALEIAQQEMQQQLNQLQSSVQNQGLLEMAQMLERLQTEVRKLRGQIEQQAHELEGLRKRQRDLYLDIDRRLNDLQLQGSTDAGGQSASPSQQTGTTDTAAPTSSPSAADAGKERSDYKAAFETLREGRYEDAIAAFNTFLKRYPDGGYADNAQYWLGEAHYVSQQFDQAVNEFRKVIDDHPDSTKVPDAKLKLGYTYYELQQWDQARRMLQGVVDQHPNTSVAPLAEKRLMRMNEEGH